MSRQKTGIPLQSLLFPHSPHFKTSKFYCNILPIFIVLHAKNHDIIKTILPVFQTRAIWRITRRVNFYAGGHYENRLRSMFIAAVLVGTVVAGSFYSSIFCSGSEKDTIFWRFKPVSNSRSNGIGWNLGNQLESVTDNVPEETNWEIL